MATREEISTVLRKNGYKESRWGYFVKETPQGHVRFKMQATSVRVERAVETDPERFWVKITGGYYKHIVIENGKIIFTKKIS